MRITMITACLAVLAGGCWAETYYIRTMGSNSNDGLSPANAFASLEHFAKVARAGDTVYIGGGVYTEQARFSTSGTEDEPITVIGDTGGEFTGDEGVVELGYNSSSEIVRVTDADHVRFYGLRFQSGQEGLRATNASGIVIAGCVFDDARDKSISVIEGSSVRVSDCEISSRKSGISVSDSSVSIVGCAISDCGDDGVKIEGGASGEVIATSVVSSGKKGIKAKEVGAFRVERCVVTGSDNHGISVESGTVADIINTLVTTSGKDGIHTHKACTLRVWNCTLALNEENGLYVHDGGTLEVINTIAYANREDGFSVDRKKKRVVYTSSNNLAFANEMSDYYGFSPDSSDLSADPRFAGVGDYRLSPSSPAIDAGVNTSALLSDDLLETTRPLGRAWDIGCYEGMGEGGVTPVRVVRWREVGSGVGE